jgi:Sec-independent protein translocase protein TatA
MFGLGPLEILAIGVIAVMLYGKRLPEVGKTVGKSLAELRRQWATISRDLDVAGQLDERGPGSAGRAIQPSSRYDEEETVVSGPVFDAPPPPLHRSQEF